MGLPYNFRKRQLKFHFSQGELAGEVGATASVVKSIDLEHAPAVHPALMLLQVDIHPAAGRAQHNTLYPSTITNEMPHPGNAGSEIEIAI